ncbi:MAG: ShlB/FhaC/HecB family hemolysin secretion/activation protein [Alphaproteobacteria bacterium]
MDSIRAAAIGAGLAAGLLVVGVVQAQGTGGIEQPRPGDRRLELPPLPPAAPQGRFELPPIPEPPADAPLSSGLLFELKVVRFTGNEAVPTADLDAVAGPFIGREVGAEDLERLRQALSALYIERGYINSGATLPDQRVVDGVVSFALVEGRLSDIKVTGANRLRPGYVEERLRQAAGPPLNVNDLQKRFRILLDDPVIERLDARLGPGVRPGESELTVDVRDAKPVYFTVTAANDRSPSVGGEALTASLLLRSLTGWGETIEADLTKASGLTDGSLGFSFPFTATDTRVSLRGQISESEVVDEPFNLLDVQSEASDVELRISQPLYRDIGKELTAHLVFARRMAKTELLGRRFSFADGPQDGVSRVSVARFVVDWLDRSSDQVIALRVTGSQGMEVLGATENTGNGFPDSDFTALLAQGQYVRRTDWLTGVSFVGRFDAQFTPDRLLSLEKFAIGGAGTVRGYRENLLVRDNGLVVSAEARVPVWRIEIPGLSNDPGDGQVELAPFYDFGRAWDNSDADNRPHHLSSFGLGVRWAPARHVRGSLYVAHRLHEVPRPDNSDRQDYGIHFRVSVDLY